MHLKTTALSLTTALALAATPALAAPSTHAAGKLTSPAQLCKTLSHKKTNHGKGKSPFAACVSGAARAQVELKAKTTPLTAPAKLCKDMSKKKSATDTKSPFAACVVGAAKAQNA
ncbi:MAG TPA: hypothetical protein VL120_18365 [Solirubrobacteraceae bacterium]|nr:hypothetical protein [Solirubrobacteraceae bacterium]